MKQDPPTDQLRKRPEMKQIKFVKTSVQSVFQKAKRLAGLHPKRGHSLPPRNSLSNLQTDNGLNVNIMSFNIRRGTRQDGKNHWIFRRDLVNEILRHYSPDVLGLQEALDFQISEIHAMLPGYEMIRIISSGNNKVLHNAIFYDASRFDVSEEGTFWYSDTPDQPGSKGWGNIMPRNCTWTRLIEKESGKAFYFYNTHLNHLSQRSRKKGVLLLTRRISARSHPDAFVLTGDFNSREKSVAIQYLKGNVFLNTKAEGMVQNPDPLMDTFRVRYPLQRNASTFHMYRPFFFRFKLDYIFVHSTVRVHDAQIITLRRKHCYPSDHFPLFSHIHLPAGIAPSFLPGE
jgi:endonuclease/exonuclease/phosphatase family metal-dependent hydrolase